MTEPAPQRAHWSGSGQLRGTPAGIRFFIMAVRLLGLRFAYACAAPVAVYYSFVSPDIPATIEYHRRVFGPQPRWKQRWLVCKHFFSFGLMLIDRIAILAGNLRPFSFRFDGEEYLHAAIAEGRGVVLLNAHLGNWEAAGQLLDRIKVPVNVAGLDREAAVVRDLLTEAARARFRYIKLDGSPTDVIPVIAALRRGEVVAMLADRSYGSPVTHVPFLGDLAPFPVGPYLLAALAGAPLIHVFCAREPGGHYRFLGFPSEQLIAPPRPERPAFLRECAARYAQRLETLVRRYPFQWFNFYPFWETPLPGFHAPMSETVSSSSSSSNSPAASTRTRTRTMARSSSERRSS